MRSSRFLPIVPVLFTALLPSQAHAISFVDGGWISSEATAVSAVKTVDFNHDGRTDAVITENQGTRVVWLENLGGGRFRQAGLWESGSNGVICHGIEDFDGDGNLDLLVPSAQGAGKLSIYYGTGPGKFSAVGETQSLDGDDGTYATAKDVNGDGRPDILSGHLWLNQGDGTFVAVDGSDAIASLPGSEYRNGRPYAWSDSDALPDLFVSGGDGGVIRYKNLGGGKFAAGVVAIAGAGVSATGLALAVLPDISDQPCLVRTVRSNVASGVEVYTQSGGIFSLAAKLHTSAYSAGLQALKDGDRSRILLVVGGQSTVSSPVELRVTRKGAKVGLKLAVLEKPGKNIGQMGLIDVNGDGANDLLLAGSGVGWHAGAAGAAFSNIRNVVSSPDYGATVRYAGDLDHDGAVDLVTQTTPTNIQPPRITLWKNSGHGESFQATTLPVVADRVAVVAVGDWAHDGWPDLLVRTTKLAGKIDSRSTNRLLLISRLPNGRTVQKTLLTNTGLPWADAHLIQADADGILDFEAEMRVSGDSANHFLVYRGLTETTFATKPSKEGPLPYLVTYLDTDWDGDLDALTRPDSASYNPTTWGGPVIITGQPLPYMPGGYSSNAYFGGIWPAGADFDGDGHPDYLSKVYGEDTPVLARPNSGSAGVPYPLSPDAADYGNYSRIPNTLVTYADVDGDRDADAIYQTTAGTYFQENLGSLNFAAPVPLSGAFQSVVEFQFAGGSLLTADLDGDGVQDIIASSASTSSQLRWFKGVRN
jgi:hypothetical protein